MISLFIGGEKSGKSDLALERFLELEPPRALVVTGKAQDFSFRRRIEKHRMDPRRSGSQMIVSEAGLNMPSLLTQHAERGVPSVLVDSLDFWVFAVLEDGGEEDFERRLDELAAALAPYAKTGRPDAVLVTCEVGLGPIAATSAVRRFVRCLGECNRRLAAMADEAVFCTAGLPMRLKTL